MFDLNELPENDGPTAKVSGSSNPLSPVGSKIAKAREGDDYHNSRGKVEVDEVSDIGKGDGVGQNEHTFYPDEKAVNSGCDLAEENHTRVKAAQKSYLRLESTLSVFHPKARAESSLDEADPDNEATGAAGHRRAIPDVQYENGPDSNVAGPTGPGSNFGISPRPEKLGQRPEISRRQLLPSPRLSGKWAGGSKWPGVLTTKKTGGRAEGELKLDRRHSPTVSGVLATKIGKRTRDDRGEFSADTFIGLKRRGSPATILKSNDEAGPSLSMSFDQSKVLAKTPSFSSSRRVSLEREAATTLSLGEPHLKGVEPLTVSSPLRTSPSLNFKSEYGLSIAGASTGKRLGSSVNNLTPVSNIEEDEGTDDSVASRKMNWPGRKSFDKSGSFEKPFWQGRFSVEGSWTIEVAAYCSQYLHPASKLWSLPRVITVERLVKMEELLETLRRYDIFEPPMRFQLQPGEVKRAQSFSSLVTMVQSKEELRNISPQMQFVTKSGSDAFRKKPMQLAGASDVLQATLKLKQTKHAPPKNPAKLYLVGTANCEVYPEIRKYFLRELNRSVSRSDNVLFGFLCAGEEESGRFAKASRPEYDDMPQGVSHVSGLKDDEQGVLSTRLYNRNDGVADSFVSNSSSDRRSQDAFNGENERARRDNHSHRHNLSPVDGEVHQERDKLRERDSDLRSREKDRDFRSLSKSFRREPDRLNEMLDVSKQGISKDREFDWSKDRSQRDPHWDQEKEKQKDRLRYREREEMENSGRKRFRSTDSDKETEVESIKPRFRSNDLPIGKETQDDQLEDEGKRRGTNGLEDVSSHLTSARELNVAHPRIEGHPATGDDEMVKPGVFRHQEKPSPAVHGASGVEVRETVSSKSLHEVECDSVPPLLTRTEVVRQGDVKFDDRDDHVKATLSLHDGHSGLTRVAGVGPAQKDSARYTGSKVSEASGVENARDSALEKALEDQSFDVKDRDHEGGNGKDFGECTLESLSNDGEKEDSEINGVTGHAHGPPTERSNSPELQDEDVRTKPKSSSWAQAANFVAHAPDRSKIHESELTSGHCLEGNYALPATEKTVISGADDSPGNLAGAESPPIDNGLGGPSLSMSVDSRDILLEGCDKETRVWLVSDQYTRYLSEEFGVRIAKFEEAMSTKSDSSVNKDRGSLDVRVILTTEKSTDAMEANWFMDQAADMIVALSSRGVFSKYLWYQGQVQRYANDHAPTIRVIVRKLKGQDGRNLERIQDETGVMIGIVHTKKEIVDSARVIGLRLNGTRKKALEEATILVQGLLSEVAEKFSKVLRPTQDVARLKPKSEFPESTSPPPGNMTPMLKDSFVAFSPAAAVASLDNVKHKLKESSSDVVYSTTAPGDGTLGTLGELALPSHSDDEREDKRLTTSASLDAEVISYRNSILVRNIPKDASGPMLREVFEDALKIFGSPSNDDMSDMVVDVKLSSDKSYALVELASDELLPEVLEFYANSRHVFRGLELGPTGNVKRSSSLERLFPASLPESDNKGLDYDGGPVDSPNLFRSRSGRKGQDGDDRQARVFTVHSNADSDYDMQSQDRRIGSQPPGAARFLRPGERAPSLLVTELMRNDNEDSIAALFEDIIKEHVPHAVGDPNGCHVKDIRFMPASGCAFVDLATPELVDAILDLYSQRPEIFHHMKVGRKPVPPSQGGGDELPVVKRPAYFNRNASLEMSHSFRGGRKGREYFQSSSPRGNDLTVMDHVYISNNYEEDEQEERQSAQRKHRSDPERTVYADRLPDGVTEEMITGIFEQVLRDTMTNEQREIFGEDVVEQVRYVPAKYCAFIVFKTQQLTRLVLQLYNQDEEIFKNMRLKPHFHSKMEDLYKVDDVREREDVPPHRSLTRDLSTDRRKRRAGMDDHQTGYLTGHGDSMLGTDLGSRGRLSFVHRAVASTAYKEVDRRRSVYVDRIPERLMPEPTMRDTFERALKQSRRGYGPRMVSEVTFFRDKFDHERLCAFVELENEELVQELLDIHMGDESAFFGMRVRPAVKYGNG